MNEAMTCHSAGVDLFMAYRLQLARETLSVIIKYFRR